MNLSSIKLDHLRYFVAAAQAGSFAEAGHRLNVTATSIAHGVTALESALGTTFLVRKRASGVVTNQEGKRFLVACQKILLEMENLALEFQTDPLALSGQLVVGCQEGLAWSIAPRVIEILRHLHPELSVSVKTTFMDDELRPLENGDVDVLVTFKGGRIQSELYNKLERNDFYSVVLCQPKPYALMKADHPLALKHDTHVTLAELAEYPNLIIDDGPSLVFFSGIYEAVGLAPRTAMASNASPVAQSILGRSESVSVRTVRPSITQSPLGDEMAFMQISDETRRPDVIAVTHYTAQGQISAKAKAFIEVCQAKFEDRTFAQNFFY